MYKVHTYRLTSTQTKRQTDIWTYRPIDLQTDSHSDEQTYMYDQPEISGTEW